MLSQKTLSKPLVLAAVIVAAATVLAALPGQDGAESRFAIQKETKKGGDEVKMPSATYSAQLPSDPAERAIRIARSGRYDKRHTVPFDESPPDTVAQSLTSEWYLYLPALPTAESDAVVLGKVVDGKGYLSSDKTGAYSEFTVLIDEVFKFSDSSLVPGVSIIAEREGANVRLRDGRVIRYQIAYQGMPQPGRQYVLFLKYEPQGDDYPILTGYEVRKGRVFPLDGGDHFATYENSIKETFFNELREALLHPPKAPRANGF